MNEYVEIGLRMGAAVLAGGLIGAERSHHGRPAGFRTHTLVSLASTLLMLVPVYQDLWFAGILAASPGRVVIDPTRMAQGIMAGIGFVGAGTIVTEGLSVRGLTTAASIWITAAIGVVLGLGFYFPAVLATVLTVAILTVFRWIEDSMPVQSFARCTLRFQRDTAMPEPELRRVVSQYGFSIASLNYGLTNEGKRFEYRMVLRTFHAERLEALAVAFNSLPDVLEFQIAPTIGELRQG